MAVPDPGPRRVEGPRGRPFLWLFTWALLLLSLALGVCGQLPRSLHLIFCRRLQELVILVAKSVAKFIGG